MPTYFPLQTARGFRNESGETRENTHHGKVPMPKVTGEQDSRLFGSIQQAGWTVRNPIQLI
jgi:hypothetical protein